MHLLPRVHVVFIILFRSYLDLDSSLAGVFIIMPLDAEKRRSAVIQNEGVTTFFAPGIVKLFNEHISSGSSGSQSAHLTTEQIDCDIPNPFPDCTQLIIQL